ncbi:MAG: hypothetical protein R2764_03415 [Bacteroidales bacterium]
MEKKTAQRIILLAIFSIAMGFLESAVVVYLRKIYYKDGFQFPLQPIDQLIGKTEILREACTLIMLVILGMMNGRTKTEKFGFFLFCFAIWDIFYYVFLKILLGWPESLLTWDVLFLIPVTWVGPVFGPIINSLTMIILALFISYFTDKSKQTRIILKEWVILILGSLIIIISYTSDYVTFIRRELTLQEIITFSEKVHQKAAAYIPENFCWPIFLTGELILLSGIWVFYYRNYKRLKIRN